MGAAVLFGSKAEIFAFIDTRRSVYPVTRLCRRYGVTPGGYSAATAAWGARPTSAHAEQDRRLSALTAAITQCLG